MNAGSVPSSVSLEPQHHRGTTLPPEVIKTLGGSVAYEGEKGQGEGKQNWSELVGGGSTGPVIRTGMAEASVAATWPNNTISATFIWHPLKHRCRIEKTYYCWLLRGRERTLLSPEDTCSTCTSSTCSTLVFCGFDSGTSGALDAAGFRTGLLSNY